MYKFRPEVGDIVRFNGDYTMNWFTLYFYDAKSASMGGRTEMKAPIIGVVTELEKGTASDEGAVTILVITEDGRRWLGTGCGYGGTHPEGTWEKVEGGWCEPVRANICAECEGPAYYDYLCSSCRNS